MVWFIFIPPSGDSASSLFRPRRSALQAAGFFFNLSDASVRRQMSRDATRQSEEYRKFPVRCGAVLSEGIATRDADGTVDDRACRTEMRTEEERARERAAVSSAATWQLEQGRGLLTVASTARPSSTLIHLTHGLTEIQAAGRDLAGVCLLGVQIPGFPDPLPNAWVVDQYVRRNDLIATYERPEPDHLRVQVYWRHVWEEAAAETERRGTRGRRASDRLVADQPVGPAADARR